MNRNQMLENLKSLGITENAIADKNARVDGSPAILLRWNGKEEYYTGFGEMEYETWLKETFGNKGN